MHEELPAIQLLVTEGCSAPVGSESNEESRPQSLVVGDHDRDELGTTL
jgi:hypothetical protein